MQPKTHVVIIGGSLAGLLMSRVLANHFERVTIVERDAYPDQPLPPIYAYYGNENRQRHYDQYSHPSHLIVVGHAACLLNPTYGQAMTVAANEAVTVDKFFQHHTIKDIDARTRNLQKQLAKAHREAWSMAIGVDYRYKSAQAKPRAAIKQFVNWYWDQLMELTVERATVRRTFLEVLHLLKPSIALFQPSILAQVLLHNVLKHWQQFVLHQQPIISNHKAKGDLI